MANRNLNDAKNAKNDEFYTQFDYVQREMNAYVAFNKDVFKDKCVLLPCDDPEWSNFTKYFAQKFDDLGLRKLVSTSFAPKSKSYDLFDEPTVFETESPNFDEQKSLYNGRIFTLSRDDKDRSRQDIENLKWSYLEEDGDFRSAELLKLRDESDIIITNPPFSLIREFLPWLIESKKLFSIIATVPAVTTKEVFPLIMNDKAWLGATANGNDMVFRVPEGFEIAKSDKDKAARLGYVGDFTRLGNACWFTNIDHGSRHDRLPLMTMQENIKYSENKMLKENGYITYDEYDAIEIPETKLIPRDHSGKMGVPITFLHKYNPEQFEILGIDRYLNDNPRFGHRFKIKGNEKFARIVIRTREVKVDN